MGSLLYMAKRGTSEDFLAAYEGADADPTALLIPGVSNKVPEQRVSIAMRLLDDGADASVSVGNDRVNALHVLFDAREHDFELEAPLLRRLLEGGADPNLRSPRFGTPLQKLREVRSDQELEPFYDVLFERPDLDFGVVVRKTPDGHEITLREAIREGRSYPRPELRRRMLEYEAARGVDAG